MDLIYNETGPSYDAGTTNREASRGLALRAVPRRAHTHTRAIAIQRRHERVPCPSNASLCYTKLTHAMHGCSNSLWTNSRPRFFSISSFQVSSGKVFALGRRARTVANFRLRIHESEVLIAKRWIDRWMRARFVRLAVFNRGICLCVECTEKWLGNRKVQRRMCKRDELLSTRVSTLVANFHFPR